MKTFFSKQRNIMQGMVFCCATLLVTGWYGCTKKEYQAVPVVSILKLNDTLFNIGDTIKISGSNFNTEPAQNLVSLSSVALRVFSADPNNLKAVVTPAARTGQLSVSFAGGRSVSYPGTVHIITSGEPFIRSVVPATATAGDTVIIRGRNFGSSINLVGITMGGGQANVFNVTDTLIRVVVPANAATGNVVVTNNGLASTPYQLTVISINPLADGRFYWLVPYRSTSNQQVPNPSIFYKGGDINKLPYGSVMSQLGNDEVTETYLGPKRPGYIYDINSTLKTYNSANIVTDADGNGYYLYYSGITSTAATVSLIKLQYKPTYSRTVLWSQPFTTAGVGTTVFTNANNKANNIPNWPMARLALDGTMLYVKMGLSNNYYIGDISAGTFSPTLQAFKLPDNLTYGIEYGQSYVFYGIAGAITAANTAADRIVEIHYAQRGATTSKKIPLDPALGIVNFVTDPSHQDNLLIYANLTTYNGSIISGYTGVFYRFNAVTGILTKLYDQNNWPDAVSNVAFSPTGQFEEFNQGFAWVNNHIYYVNKRRTVNGIHVAGLYRLDDDGSSLKPLNIYAMMDIDYPGSTIASYIPFFIDKTQARP